MRQVEEGVRTKSRQAGGKLVMRDPFVLLCEKSVVKCGIA
jgi:hypothetical protein